MAAKNEPKKEQEMSNNTLKDVFQDLHDTVVDNIATSSVIGELFSARVISINNMQELHFINNPHEKCRRLLIILHKAKNPRTFIELREAIKTEECYEWLVEKIDEKYNVMAAATAQPEVTRVCSTPSLTSRDDIAEQNMMIGGLRRDNAAVMEENTSLKVENKRLTEDNAALQKENTKLKDELERVRKSHNSAVTQNNTKIDTASGGSKFDSKKSTVHQPVDLLDAPVQPPHRMVNELHKTSRDLDVIEKQIYHSPKLLFTLDTPPTDHYDRPRYVNGLAMLENYLYVVYWQYNKVQVFDCEDRCKKIKEILVMESPRDMVGSSVTSQLFISVYSDVILRVDSKTGVSDVFVKTDRYENKNLSLVDNRLLVRSRDTLSMFNIFSGERIKKIQFTADIRRYDVDHAIESNRDSFFVSHGQWDNRTVSEIDCEGRVIRNVDKKIQLGCCDLALDSVGRLVVADTKNKRVVLFHKHLKFERILIESQRLDYELPTKLNYNKNNNRLTVGLFSGHVKIFEY